MKLLKIFIKRLIELISIFKWNYFFIRSKYSMKKKNLLAVYDTSSQPFSVDDPLVFLAALDIKKIQNKYSSIDIIILVNKGNPGSFDPVFRNIKSNVDIHIDLLLSIFKSKLVNVLSLFDSPIKFLKYFDANRDSYDIWPEEDVLIKGKYLYYEAMTEVVYENWKKNFQKANLSCNDYLKNYAGEFIKSHVGSRIPITVNLRNNTYHTRRNSLLDVWANFFDYCEENFILLLSFSPQRMKFQKRSL